MTNWMQNSEDEQRQERRVVLNLESCGSASARTLLKRHMTTRGKRRRRGAEKGRWWGIKQVGKKINFPYKNHMLYNENVQLCMQTHTVCVTSLIWLRTFLHNFHTLFYVKECHMERSLQCTDVGLNYHLLDCSLLSFFSFLSSLLTLIFSSRFISSTLFPIDLLVTFGYIHASGALPSNIRSILNEACN